MRSYFIVAIIALLAITALAAGEMGAYVKDHTTQILGATLPDSVPVSQFSDFAALVTGQTPRFSDSPVPMTNALKRAQASVTIVTQDALPTTKSNIKLTNSNASLSAAGAIIAAIQGQNKCLMGSKSLFDAAYVNSQDSLVFSFAQDELFAESFCAHLPTTTPPAGGYKQGQSICATLSKFVGSTDEKYSSAESNSAIGQAVSVEKNTVDFAKLTEDFQVQVTDTEVVINGVTYERNLVAVDNIIRELAYIVNVANKLSTFAAFTADSSPDYYTFVISSASAVPKNAELVNLIDLVVQNVVAKFAAQYNNNMLSTVIQTTAALPSFTCALADQQLGATAAAVVTTEQIRSYQIVLWLVITLILVAVGGFTATAQMHIQPDSALQGGVSTYWTQKRN